MEVEKVEVVNVVEKMELFGNLHHEFNNVFAQFSSPIKETTGCVNDTRKDDYEAFANDAVVAAAALNKKKRKNDIDGGRLSHKTRKLQQQRMKIAKLKQKMRRGDVVEGWDATAAHPELLISLKSYRNSVPVPRHWCHKRKFLQGNVGIEKQPFRLPEFIAATGIKKIREAYIEKEDKSDKKLKQKQREKRIHPKMGSIDVNYRVLEDAFFKYQTKPKLTAFGDVYYEGKEFEVELDREMKPGMLSELLKEAFGMPEGAPPPPWLISMQRHGPPPSYPQLKIPGVNAPIPPRANFGYHPGGWGKAPVDEYARPLYGNVFGVQQSNHEEELVGNTKHWGDLEEKEEAEVEEQTEEEEEEEEEEADIQSFDSVSSTPSTGVGTPDVIDLRKRPRKEPEKYLYRVLEKKEERIAPGTLLGTSRVCHWLWHSRQDCCQRSEIRWG
ncbi:uncharacterized protein LOC131335672 [Rhododendron vialii]|uniref:uncharacterized protein LOC131335672 n=1 Tax=Rhododendron vialii TaxID=182163 RepID=UPI00265D6608|nr:uncharacterized protein LOC131335672 [Rhododendron vialii]